MNKKDTPADTPENHLVVFQERSIRRTWHHEEWWFAVTDVMFVLTESANVTDYIKKMRLRDKELSQGWGQIVTPLRFKTEGGAVAGNARKELEAKTGKPVVSRANYLALDDATGAKAKRLPDKSTGK